MENEFKITRKKKNNNLNKLIMQAKEDSSAQFKLGVKYYNGDGVEQNYEEAAKWFTKSAENGNQQAQYNLAVMYEDGEGVKQNIDEAKKWYKMAADQGDKDAKKALKELKNEYDIENLKELNYSDSLKTIKKIEKIAEKYGNLGNDEEIKDLNAQIKKHEDQVKKIKEGKAGCSNVVGIIAGVLSLIVWLIIKLGADDELVGNIGCVAFLFIILGGSITLFSKLFGKKGLEKKANEYIQKNIDPIKEKLSKINKDKQKFLQKEKTQWAIKIVGDDIFFNLSAINAIIELIKDGEANNLQEAINIYRRGK